jgi:hypothetical protein
MFESIYAKLSPDGKVFIELPHVGDVKLSTYNLESIKAFTFWSELLVLHTRNPISAMLSHCGFKNIEIVGFQSYPLANHLYWMLKNRPGGHQVLSGVRTKQLDEAYANMFTVFDLY